MRSVTKVIVAIIIGLVALTPFASTDPDGLERVAESLGIGEPQPIWSGLMPDYTLHLAENPYLTKLISGLVGLFLILGVAWVVGWTMARKERVQK